MKTSHGAITGSETMEEILGENAQRKLSGMLRGNAWRGDRRNAQLMH